MDRAEAAGPSAQAADYLAGRVPPPELPPEAAACPACGWEPAVTVVVEVVVSSPEEARALEARRPEARP